MDRRKDKSVKHPRVLVLGGGSGQLSLIRRLKRAGVSLIIQDRNPECIGRSLAEEFIRADTRDAAAAAAAAGRFKVDAVLTAGTDQPVYAASFAAAERGCPSLLDTETAKAVTDKEVMKKVLSDAGLPVPRHRFAGGSDGRDILIGLKPPYVVKPVDSQGQRGVLKFDSSDDFPKVRDASLKWSNRGRITVEEYHPNREITVSGWVYDSRLRIWAVTDRVTRDFPPHIGLCLAHRFPSTYAAPLIAEVEEFARRSTRALGVENGPVYYQFLITDEGLMVNETAARLGGAYEDESLPRSAAAIRSNCSSQAAWRAGPIPKRPGTLLR
jgi:phosphoribosylaminoimidazole carboxylase (NCAIR synthetase)